EARTRPLDVGLVGLVPEELSLRRPAVQQRHSREIKAVAGTQVVRKLCSPAQRIRERHVVAMHEQQRMLARALLLDSANALNEVILHERLDARDHYVAGRILAKLEAPPGRPWQRATLAARRNGHLGGSETQIAALAAVVRLDARVLGGQ